MSGPFIDANNASASRKVAPGSIPCKLADIPWQEFSEGEIYAMRYQSLSEIFGQTELSVAHEILPPGKGSTAFHYHMFSEEHIVVLEGALSLRLGEGVHVMDTGSYVCFPAGRKVPHAVFNHTSEPCRYLAIANPKKEDVIVFPENDLVSVKALDSGFRESAALTDWNRFLARPLLQKT
jgi:uncharacterized cupin superfamily protein